MKNFILIFVSIFVLTFVMNAQTVTLDIPIAQEYDDAEEKSDGSMDPQSSDLEMIYEDGDYHNGTGLRFQNVDIPKGVTVIRSYIQFTVDELGSPGEVTLTIKGEKVDNSVEFTDDPFSVSSRDWSEIPVYWTPDEWLAEGDRDTAQRTADISLLVQEIINRDGWLANNAMSFDITGPDNVPVNRVSESFGAGPDYAPSLHIEYVTLPDPYANWDFETIVDDTVVIDGSDNGFDGITTIVPGIVPGYDGNTAINFNDGDLYMNIEAFTTSLDFTIAMWVKWDATLLATGGWHLMYEFDRADWEQWNAFYAEQWEGSYGMSMVDDSWSFNSGTSLNEIDFTKWHHVAYTRDADNNAKLYLDGNLESDAVEAFEFAVKTAPLFIGGNFDGEMAAGALDEVKYFNSVLSDDQIAALAMPPNVTMFTLTTNIIGQGTTATYYVGSDVPINDTQFFEDTELMLVATPINGFEFYDWTGDIISTDDTIYITMDADKSVTANFEDGVAYELTLETGGNGEGSIDGEAGLYKEGMDVDLSATPDEGYLFSGWTGDVTSPDESITVNMDSDKSLIANFNSPEYQLTVTVVGNGTVTPENGMYSGEVTIVATPDEGYHFEAWSGDIESTAKTLYVVMDANLNLTATFAEGEESSLVAHWPIDAGTDTIVYDISGNGFDGTMVGGEWDEGRPGADGHSIHITSHEGGLPDYIEFAPNTPQFSSADLSFAFWVKFNSMPGAWTQLVCHGGDDFDTYGEHHNDFAFVTDGDDHVNMIQHCTMGGKNFHSWFPSEYTVTTNTWIHIAVTVNENDSVAKIYINGNLNAIFESWVALTPDLIPNKTRFGVDVGGWGGVADMNVDDMVWFNTTLTDEEISELVGGVNLTTIITGAGTIGGAITQDADTLVSMMPTGGEVTLTALPVMGGEFFNWTGDVESDDETITFQTDNAMTVTANFKEVTAYSLNISVDGEGTVSTASGWEGKYAEGYVETLTATPKNTGYAFVEWTGDISSAENPIDVTMNSDINITAVFEAAGFQLTVTMAGTGSGTVTPENGTYTGSQFLTAVADEGSKFVGWTGDVEGETNVVAIYMDSPKNVTATFDKTDGIFDQNAPKFNLINYPNPFDNKTTIEYSIDESSTVTLIIYDVFGKKIDVLVNKELKVGNYSIEWDAGNLPKGFYLYRLQSNSRSITKKMLLSK